MPEITVYHIAIIAGTVALGVIIGWVVRGKRCAEEKVTVSEGWQLQLDAQRKEHDRLIEQNKTLMEQISQFQASGKDATNRARELSTALKEAFARRDELQRELKEIRSNLEVAVRQRDKLHSDIQSKEARGDSAQEALKEREEKIVRLSRELEEWHSRLPPLMERYRQRDEEAVGLENDLASALDRIAELENLLNSDETRIEPVDPEALGDELDASNDPSSITQSGIADVLEEDAADPVEDDDAGVVDEVIAEVLDGGVEDALGEDAAAKPDEDSVDSPVEFESVEDETSGAAIPDAILGDELGTESSEFPDYEESDGAVAVVNDEDEPDIAEVTEFRDRDAGSVRDDLKLIKGVGPAIEKTLNELGIFRFHQIAEMSEYDIDRVAQRLKGFRTRIYREDWIGQARDLQFQKSGT